MCKVKRTKLNGMDGLRAFAIIGIVLYHMMPQLVPGGFLGVSMFFILSGYLITRSELYSYENRDRMNVIRFYFKRIKRIYPALLITLCLTVVAMELFARESMGGIRRELSSIVFGYNNLWQISENSSYFSSVAGKSPFIHMWSLAVELQFYAVFPLIFLASMKLEEKYGRMVGCYLNGFLFIVSVICIMVTYNPSADPTNVYYGTFTRIGTLFLGSALAFFERSINLQRQKLNRGLTTVTAMTLMAVMTLLYFKVDGTSAVTYLLVLPVFSILCVTLTALISVSPVFGKIIEAGPLGVIGADSYQIYLVMYPVIYFVSIKSRINSRIINLIIEVILIAVFTNIVRFVEKMFKVERSLSKYRTSKSLSNLRRNRGVNVKKKAAISLSLVMAVLTAIGVISAPSSSVSASQKQLAGKYDNVTTIDWPSVGEKNPSWFYDDGFHLNSEGQEGYAAFISKNIG